MFFLSNLYLINQFLVLFTNQIEVLNENMFDFYVLGNVSQMEC